MPAEYAARMEVLERRREELTAQRQAVEKRMALREATAAEFSAVALQSCRQKWKTQRSAAIAAQKRNDEFVRSLREAQRQVHNTCVKLQGDQSRSGVLLAQEKACYNRRIEQVYPAWQEQLQRHRVQKLKELEDKKRAVERRRYLAKKSFEKEQTLDDLIRKTRHEVEMAENLEQNELYERELLRTQSTNQAKEVDQGIREVALDARSYLQQQAAKHLEMMPELDEELAEKLSETFSPRNTLRALREGGSSLAFEENQPYEEEKPARQIQVEIPARMNTSTLPYYPDVNQQGPNQAFHYDDVEFQDDYDNEIACEFDDRAAHPNPPRTERRVAQTITNAGNGYTTFKQSANTHQPAFVAQRDQPPATMFRSLDTEPGATASQTASYYGNEQDRTAPSSVPIRNEKHNKTVDVSRERVDILPTLVTGTLETIPEANETVSSGGTSPMISSKPIADNNMADRLNGREKIAETKSSIPPIEGNPHTTSVISVVDSVESHVSAPETPVPEAVLEETNTVSITEKLSPVDRVKALGALISRVEEGATEGDTLGGSTDTGSSNKSKRDLLKMAVGGRKAQIAFFGSDICFELVLDISRDLGPVLFPPKAFEGIMNDQKIRKLHQSNKEKQLDLWKALSGHLKQLVQLKAISSTTLVDLFVTAFLAHDPENQRSQRKLREFLAAMCGGGGSRTPSPRKEISLASPPPSPPKQEQRSSSPESTKTADSEDRIRPPPLLQTAFLQRQSPPKPKVFGIASSSFNDRSSGSSDVLASMSAGPMKLSQKLMRGGKMNDYSEFEEEEEVDLQNLIGTKSAFASGSSSMGRGSYQTAKTSPTGKSAAKKAAAEEEEDEFDADF
ncbi:hypothetical protein PF004_g2720 [Phytophthora fragariae]|uniref:Uncharacterized protein n=1 Tax=Phytophthora fragariae TaxID=53985 RepID=A0A6G0PNN6_9STRA|nr:hypothetical protein PF004_g2720 [Phytophthora fragariae]